MKINARKKCLLTAIGAMSLFLSACAEQRLPEKVIVSLKSIREEITAGRSSFENAAAGLQGLSDSTPQNRAPVFADYSKRVQALAEKAGGAGLVVGMQVERSDEFFANWDSEITKLNDQDLQDRGTEQHQKALAQFQDVKAKIARLRASFRPFMSNLQDVNRYLATDPTQAGFNAAKPSIRQAQDRAAKVRSDFDSLTKTLDSLIGA